MCDTQIDKSSPEDEIKLLGTFITDSSFKIRALTSTKRPSCFIRACIPTIKRNIRLQMMQQFYPSDYFQSLPSAKCLDLSPIFRVEHSWIWLVIKIIIRSPTFHRQIFSNKWKLTRGTRRDDVVTEGTASVECDTRRFAENPFQLGWPSAGHSSISQWTRSDRVCQNS